LIENDDGGDGAKPKSKRVEDNVEIDLQKLRRELEQELKRAD
jgi:hypothetical protein